MISSGRTDGTLAAAFALAAFAVICWGVTPAVTALQVSELPAVLAGVMRSVFAVPAAVVCIWAMRLKAPADRSTWGLLVFSGTAAFFAFPVLFTMGVAETSTTHAALILACIPVVAGAVGSMLERRWPRPAWYVGAVLAVVGEVVLIGGRDGSGEATLRGDLLVAVAATIAAVGYVFGSLVTARIGTWSTTFWSVAVIGSVQIPLLVWLGADLNWGAVTWIGWSATAFVVMFSTVLAYAAWYWALNRGSVVRIAPVQFSQPVVSVFVAVLLLGEVLTGTVALATLMIIGGIVLASRGRRPAPQPVTAREA